ncbi:uncharacterized protein LOC133301586 [Gastrolobium bilobum]|uniref:uncharacterized protein LOC133301586 n=1 Tax=Gastrolobium bilobum TaxID=150636 RepID=UPI002AB1B572|nr:uncharacterized protein LOC133301586 [Gastrolobium bilobum]
MGDFNSYLRAEEKTGGLDPHWISMRDFQNCLVDCDLSDIGFKGPSITWKSGKLFERLDRACSNGNWNVRFPNRFLSHLLFYSSDHRPIILLNGTPPRGTNSTRPFRFMASWLTCDSFPGIVNKCWGEETNWIEASENFKAETSKWHNETYKEANRRKFLLHARIKGIDERLSRYHDSELEAIQINLWKELNEIYMHEEILWFQRSRCKWLKFGDRNSKFFHSTTIARRRANIIDSLKDENGNWIGEPDLLVNMIAHYFEKLYSEENTCKPAFLVKGAFPTL